MDGSFLEDIEHSKEARPPRDLDVVTFYWPSSSAFAAGVAAGFPILIDHAATKARFLVDHYFEDLAFHPARTVERAAYWNSLFSHRRDDVQGDWLEAPNTLISLGAEILLNISRLRGNESVRCSDVLLK